MQPNSPHDLAASLSRANTTLGRISQNQQANARIANEYARQIAAGTALIAYEMQIQNDLLASINNEIRRTNALLGSILQRLASIDFSLKNPDYIHSMESVRRGVALLERGLYEDANIEFLGSIDQYRTCTAGFYYLALCQHARGDVVSAVSSIKKAMQYGSVEESFSEESLIGLRACRFLLREYPDSVTSDEHASIQAILAKYKADSDGGFDEVFWAFPTSGSRLDYAFQGKEFPVETSVRSAQNISRRSRSISNNDRWLPYRDETQGLNFAFGIHTKNAARVSASLCHDPNQFVVVLGQLVEADPLSRAFYDECSQIAIDNYFKIYSDAILHSYLRWLNEMDFDWVQRKRIGINRDKSWDLRDRLVVKDSRDSAKERKAIWESLNPIRQQLRSKDSLLLEKRFVGLSGLVELLDDLSKNSKGILTLFNSLRTRALLESNKQYLAKKTRYLYLLRTKGFIRLAPVLQWCVQVPFELNPSSEESTPKTWVRSLVGTRFELVPLGLPENLVDFDVPVEVRFRRFLTLSNKYEDNGELYDGDQETRYYSKLICDPQSEPWKWR